MSYKKNRHSCYDLSYHLIVVTKYRHPVIVGEIKGRLIELSYRILEKNYPCEVLEINTDVDHIHIMFDAPPQVQLSALVNSYKTVTARLLRKEFQEQLSKFYWKPVFWSQSYFIGTVSDRSRETIAQYIRDQGNRRKANPSQVIHHSGRG